MGLIVLFCKHVFLDMRESRDKRNNLKENNRSFKTATDEEIYSAAVRLSQNGSYDNALTQYDKLIEMKPKDFKLFESKIECLIKLEKYNEALDLMQLKSNVYNFKPLVRQFYDIAAHFEQNDEHSNALELYKRLERLCPHDPKPHACRLECEHVIKTNKESYKYSKIDDLCKKKEYSEAIKKIEKLIQTNPNDYKLYLLKIDCIFKMEQYQQALNCITVALIRFPTENELIEFKPKIEFKVELDKGIRLNSLGDYDSALIHFDAMCARYPNASEIYAYKADCLFKCQNYKEAIEYFDKALSQDSTNLNCLSGKANALLELKLFTASNEIFAKLVEMDSRNPHYCFGFGKSLMEMTKKNDLIERKIPLRQMDEESIIDNRSLNLKKLTDYEKALYFMKKAIDKIPSEKRYFDECNNFIQNRKFQCGINSETNTTSFFSEIGTCLKN